MAIDHSVKALLELAVAVAPKLQFADSAPAPTDPPSGDRIRARIEVADDLANLPAMSLAAKESCPSVVAEIIGLCEALNTALHVPGRIQQVGDAHRALEVAAYQAVGVPADGADKKTDNEKKLPPHHINECARYIKAQRKLIADGKRPRATKKALIAEHLGSDDTDAMERELQPSRYGWVLDANGQADK